MARVGIEGGFWTRSHCAGGRRRRVVRRWVSWWRTLKGAKRRKGIEGGLVGAERRGMIVMLGLEETSG